jgi:3-phenylpropionate/trans-cinnamate dioxygenase ferredoxin reductase subunit
VTLNEGQLLEVDRVIVAIGSMPQSELAWAAGIATGDGILVDEYFQTDTPNIYAAGDVANYPDPILGRRRVEHEDHAVQSGRHAGMTMAGQPAPYEHLPLFYSDLFDYGYEAVGNLSPELQTVSQWEERHQKGIVYYLDDASLVRGVLLWNTWGLAEQARKLIAMGTRSTVRPLELGEAV